MGCYIKQLAAMEVDYSTVNHVVAKRLWNIVKMAFLLLRKGSVLKRKIMVDIHLMMKRGKVLLGNLLLNHSLHSLGRSSMTGFGLHDYEFSCSNSPAPFSFHMRSKHHSYFPSMALFSCIQPRALDEDLDNKSNAVVISQSEYFTKSNMDLSNLPVVDGSRPLSPFCRSKEELYADQADHQVDKQAEEFISKFYDQIRLQRQVSLLRYDEMLARGAT